MLRPLSNPQQGRLWPKIHHLDFGELLVVKYMMVIGIKDSFQSISADDHHVHNWGSVQMDQASIWNIFSIWGVAVLNPHCPWRPTYWWYLGPRLQHNWRGRQNDHNRDLIMVLEWFENLNVNSTSPKEISHSQGCLHGPHYLHMVSNPTLVSLKL